MPEDSEVVIAIVLPPSVQIPIVLMRAETPSRSLSLPEESMRSGAEWVEISIPAVLSVSDRALRSFVR